MSNPGLNRLLRSGGLTDFHVSRAGASAIAQRGNPHVLFSGEVYHGQFSMNKSKDAEGYRQSHAFEKKENREGKKEEESDSEDESEGRPSKKKRIYEPGEDADGDGKTGESKKVTDFSSKDGDDIPDAFQKKHKKDKDKD